MALALMVFLLAGCGSSKGFRLAVETGGNADQKNMGEAAEQQTLFVSDDTKALPEISGEECEQLGDALLNKGNLYSAYVQYEKSLKLKPDNIRVEYKKGLTLLLGEKNDDAIRQFEMVLKKEPKFDLANEGLGRAYFQKKDFLLAERHFKKAIDQNHKLWMSYNFLGNIYDHKKEYEKAILEYTSAIAVKPDQGLLYNNLGVSCLLAGHNQAAIDAFGKARRKELPRKPGVQQHGCGLCESRPLRRRHGCLPESRRRGPRLQQHGLHLPRKGQLPGSRPLFREGNRNRTQLLRQSQRQPEKGRERWRRSIVR